MTDWITGIIDGLGYPGVALLVALENVFPPIPSEVVLPLAGFTAAQGRAGLVGMIFAATAGSLVGAMVLYAIATKLGRHRLRRLIERYERWLRVSAQDLDRSESWFDHHAGRAVLICRCVPLIRSLVSIPAGLRAMSLERFVLYTAIGSAAWNTALIVAGYLVGDNWHVVERYMGYVQWAVVIVVAAVVIRFFWKRTGTRTAN